MLVKLQLLFLTLLSSIVNASFISTEPAYYLTTTAVISDPEDHNAAKLQCWRFKRPFTTYPTVGMAVHLADVSNLTYVVLPPRSGEGLHKPPHPMLFVLLTGIAHVTLPSDPQNPGLWIQQGVNPLIVAVDTEGPGHFTDYPSNVETAALQLPFKDGKVPEYDVVNEGACKREKQWSANKGERHSSESEQSVFEL
ncbi:hypothetical protein NA57DRAFT_51489 [Rhizodiscina lignyota]|uniref:Cupin type-1 domain-containing protein n=1 Tax=Rhizodiscina lignyota TaxID=1504668 RepID=A0A9P4INC4_9PEZI|nr:hypothetical protein NA57DRAFT_51489 [Rhizodiscina lignyota]